MLNPLQTLHGVRYDDLQRVITTIVKNIPANQIFGTSEMKGSGKKKVCNVELTVFFDGLIKNEKYAEKAIALLLKEQKFVRAYYNFTVHTKARKPIISPKGRAPLGFQDRIWDKNCQVFLDEETKDES